MATAARRVSAVDEEEFYPHTIQEELNEILEAFYASVDEDDILAYQKFIEGLQEKKISENAIKNQDVAPDFILKDQDGDSVCLSQQLKNGPVVLVFYRGKWCPHCNAYIMRLQSVLDQINAKGASLLAVSPMLPDGTRYLATKRSLEFSVLSDVGNEVANDYKLTFQVEDEFRERFLTWNEDIPGHNGDDTWEIPIPATFIIGQDQKVVWSFVDDDPGNRADVDELIASIPVPPSLDQQLAKNKKDDTFRDKQHTHSVSTCPQETPKRRVSAPTFRRSLKQVFGKRRQSAQEFLGQYF